MININGSLLIVLIPNFLKTSSFLIEVEVLLLLVGILMDNFVKNSGSYEQ